MHKAKKSHHKKVSGPKRSTRRRRLGASGKVESIAVDVLAVGGGIIGMRELSIMAGSMFPSLMATPTTTGIAEVVIGGLIAWKAKPGWLRLAGMGGAGNGLMTILNGLGVIGGPKTMSYQYANRRIGDPRLQFIAGPTTRIGSFPNNFSMVAGRNTRKPRYSS